ncbi:MAG TPA: ERAP1-like C-terminal domain-containing protein, partial [Dehalococcoidia bacterium]|nr:ERAP1-like C-terminal domain-containing protein [Dehalococcoidia bacterium]
ASVLKQLFAFVGTDALAASHAYFAKHAWGNTELDDMMRELSHASGRDLSAWSRDWLDSAGTDRLELDSSGGRFVLKATGPKGAEPRPHRLVIGVYNRDGDRLTRTRAVSVETQGAETPVDGLGEADLLLVNDDDLTFASVRPSAGSLEAMLTEAHRLPTAIGRATAFTTAWDMLMHGDLATAEFLRCVQTVLRSESVESLIEPAFELAVEAADMCSPDGDRDRLVSALADLAADLAAIPARRRVALRALAHTALSDGHFAVLAEAARDDVDLAWRTLVRRAVVREVTEAEVDALQARDPDPDSWVRALAVIAARPEATGKDAAWKAAVQERRLPMGTMRMVGRAFWQRSQWQLLAPYAERYLELLPVLHTHGMGVAGAVGGAMFPRTAGDEDFIERATTAAKRPEVSPIVRRIVIESCDRLRRRLRARRI